MLISIIVPAYNVEKYIEKCLDSLLNQTADDYQIIVVNDGSTDRTDEMIQRKYLDKVIYIDKKTNSGLSDTRNVGMQSATGEYVIFVDGDDYVNNFCIQKIRSIIESHRGVDVVYVGHIEERNGEHQKFKGFQSACNQVWNADEFLKSELGQRSFPVPACFAVYRRQFLIKNNLKFTTGIYHEDELWSAEVALKAQQVITADICYYHYVIRADSITRKKDLTQNGLDVIFICNQMIRMLNEIEDPVVKKLFANHVAMLYMKGMCRGKLYRKQYRSKFNRCIPIKYAYFTKDKLKSILFAISPYLYYRIDLKCGTKL